MTAALTHILAMVVMAGMVSLCLRRGKGARVLTLPHTFEVSRAWFVFMVGGGLFVVGIFWYAGWQSPNVATSSAWASAAAAALFGFGTIVLARVRATLAADGHTLAYRTLFWSRTADLRLLESARIEALALTLTFRADASGAKQKPLRMLAALKDMGLLMDVLAHHLPPQR